MVRIKALLAFVLVVLLLVAPLNLSPRVRAGDINNPEIVDTEGDSISGKTSHDILWAFMGYETNDTFAAVMGMKTLDTFTDPSQIQTVPVSTYEFYFTIKAVNYAATASVPVHGPFGIDIRFALNTVEYNGTTPSNETNKASITGRYDAAHGIINMTVTKSSVGGVDPGNRATNLWCGIYSKQRSGGVTMTTPVLQDRAPDNGYGGEFIFVGSPEGQIVVLEVATSSSQMQNITAFTTLKFDLAVFNNGTNTVTIGMRNSTVDPKFNVSFSPLSTTLERGRTANITMAVKIKDLRTTKDGDSTTFTVWAETNLGNSTNPKMVKSDNSIIFTVRASIATTPVKPPTGTAKLFDDLSKFFKNNKNTVIGLVVLLIVLAVVLVVYSKLGRGKKDEEFGDLQVHEKHPKKKDKEKEEAED
jgi:hypothetical protein